MRLVYKFYIRHTDELDRLFRISNNLYNQAIYLFRQRLDADGVWTWYNDMDKLIKGVTNLASWNMKKATQVNVMHWLSNQSANMKNTVEEELREDSFILP